MTQVKMVQLVTAMPTNQHALKPFLFGLDNEGIVWFWDWSASRWELLETIDDDVQARLNQE